jgi:hypothetical protein
MAAGIACAARVLPALQILRCSVHIDEEKLEQTVPALLYLNWN